MRRARGYALRAVGVGLATGLCLSGCGAGAVADGPVRETGVAASCAALSPAAQFAAARRVFVGSMLPGRTTLLDGRRLLASPARMHVTRYLKGRGPSEVTVVTGVTLDSHGVTMAEDGIEPRPGERWKIYTDSRAQPFDTSICAGSGLVGATPEPISAARSALNLWRAFPVRANRRPIVPLGAGLVLDPSSAFPNTAGKLAYLEGRFVLSTALPAGPTAAGRYPVIPAATAYGRLRATGRPQPDEVAPLIVTSVRLGTARFATDRGRASLPAWQFYFRGIAAPASVLALAPPNLFTAPALHRFGPPGAGSSIEDSATASHAGTLLTLAFPGAPRGTGPCQASYSASALADQRAVAVTITATGAPVASGVACPAIAVTRTAVVRLARPLGARVLVSSTDGGAIAVTR